MANVIKKLRKGLDINLKRKSNRRVILCQRTGDIRAGARWLSRNNSESGGERAGICNGWRTLVCRQESSWSEVCFSGERVVTSVERGERRKVMCITVQAAEEQDFEEFGVKKVAELSADAVNRAYASRLVCYEATSVWHDCWPYGGSESYLRFGIRQQSAGTRLWVCVERGRSNFQTGLDALAKMAKTYLGISAKQKAALQCTERNRYCVWRTSSGRQRRVQIHHIDAVNKGRNGVDHRGAGRIFIGRLIIPVRWTLPARWPLRDRSVETGILQTGCWGFAY